MKPKVEPRGKLKEPKEDHFKVMNERVKQIMNRQLQQFSSIDGKPLNFSFKKIRVLEEVIPMIPKEGIRKPFIAEPVEEVKEDKKSQAKEKESKEEQKQEEAKEEVEEVVKKKEQKGPQIIRTISLAVPTANESAIQQALIKQVTKHNEKKKNTKVEVKLRCTALFLSYNKIESIESLEPVVKQIMFQPDKLMWLDISHNRLQAIDCNLHYFRALKTLYVHCNYIYSIAEIQKLAVLPDLKILFVHGNPLEEVPEFRSVIIALLPSLVKLDSALVSRKERQNAKYYYEGHIKNSKHRETLLSARKKDPPPSDDQEQS